MSKPEDTLLGAQIATGDDDIQKMVDDRIRAVVREEITLLLKGLPGSPISYDVATFLCNHSHTITNAIQPILLDQFKNGIFFR